LSAITVVTLGRTSCRIFVWGYEKFFGRLAEVFSNIPKSFWLQTMFYSVKYNTHFMFSGD